jgi:hypothetical protein
MLYLLLIGGVILGMLSACTAQGTSSVPVRTQEVALIFTETVSPVNSLPTETTMTIKTEELKETSVPVVIIEQPTRVITLISPSAGPQGKVLPADIQIESPGELSRIASPLQVTVNAYPGEGGKVLVQLFGEDGRLMAEELHTLETSGSGWVQLYTSIPFEIHSAGETALLVVSTRDGFGRRITQTSVPLILLQVGKSEIELPGFRKDPFSVTTPVYGSEIRNGMVHIEGFVHVVNNNPIVGELVTETGGIIKSIVVTLPKDSVGQEYVPFTMDIPYTVKSRRPVRLTLRQPDVRLPGVDVVLDSLLIYLLP